MILFRLSTRGRHKRYPPKFKNFGYRWIPGTEEISKDGLKSKTYQFQRKDRSRENRILSNTLVALRQFPRIRCLTRTLQGRHSFLSNFSLTAIDRSSHRCKDFRGLVDKPKNWYNFFYHFFTSLTNPSIFSPLHSWQKSSLEVISSSLISRISNNIIRVSCCIHESRNVLQFVFLFPTLNN